MDGVWYTGIIMKSAESVVLFKYQTSSRGKFCERWIRGYSDRISVYKSNVGNDTAALYDKFRAYIPY